MQIFKHKIFDYIKPHSYILLLAMLCMVINALATGFYAYLIGPVVKFFFTGETLQAEWLASAFSVGSIDIGFIKNSGALILPALIIIAAILKGISQYGKFFLMGVVGEKSVFNLRADLLNHVHKLSFNLKDKITGGELITRMVSDMTILQESITNAIGSLIADSLKILVLLALAVYLDWRLSIVSFVVLPLVAIPIVKVGKKLKKTSTACQNAKENLTSHVEEDSCSFALIKNYLLHKERSAVFNSLNKEYYSASMKSYSTRAMASPVMEMMGALGLAATIFLAGSQMANGNLLPENFVSFFAAVLMLYEPMKNLGRLNTILQSGRAGAERIFEIFDWETENDVGNIEKTEFNTSIEFSGVNFSFNGRKILEDINIEIPKKQSLAIVGASGVGKTTLMRLLLRHYEPQSGEMLIDKVNIRDLKLQSLRSLVTIVEQRPVIFNATLWDNIRIAKYNSSVKEIETAIEKARLNQLVDKLPSKELTMVGERGVLLSEGEKQRIALARAFLRKSEIVILDEVTSALDSENEKAIKEAIQKLSEEKTLMIIAHRLSTISGVDKILVLEKGRIAETGSHKKLMEKDGLYKRFWLLQA